MASKRVSFKVTSELVGRRLDELLVDKLTMVIGETISKAKVRRLIVAGAVFVNYHRVRIASLQPQLNALIEATIDLTKLKHEEVKQDLKFILSQAQILFEDPFLIAIDKPPGLPTQPTIDEKRDNLYSLVKEFLRSRDKINEPYLGIHQRLDRDTSGVILFTKDPRANAGLAEQFNKHRIKKIYQAISLKLSKAKIRENWHIENRLGRAQGIKGKPVKYTAVENGETALTEFSLRENFGSVIWVEARPLTGRTHQIRVHLAETGMPILGDKLYGSAELTASLSFLNQLIEIPRMMLHAATLTFKHPIEQKEISIESPLPTEFQQCLNRLRNKSFNTKDTKEKKEDAKVKD